MSIILAGSEAPANRTNGPESRYWTGHYGINYVMITGVDNVYPPQLWLPR